MLEQQSLPQDEGVLCANGDDQRGTDEKAAYQSCQQNRILNQTCRQKSDAWP